MAPAVSLAAKWRPWSICRNIEAHEFNDLRDFTEDGIAVEVGAGMDLTSSSPQGTPTVLVVDDEPAIVDSLQKILERESLRVLTAGSGGEALDIIRRESIWVLLTDLMMPGMSGMDLLRASKSVAPETETVLMTAYGTVENAVEAMKQGAYDFVTKPI